MQKRSKPKHAIKILYHNRFWVIFLKCLGLFFAGAMAGLIFFYFFKDLSVALTERYKFLQSIFGVRQYEPGVRYLSVLGAILLGNIISTTAYFILSYFKTLIPLSVLSGFLMVILLFAGAEVRQTAVPAEVFVLFSVEAFYRCLALTGGEHLYKNRFEKKSVFITTVVVIFVLLLGAAFYEIYQVFGYIF
jgi:flagellar basal body-associated protein FliL